MSEHARPTRLYRGTLVIAADGDAWAAEVSVRSADIARKITAVLGEDAVRRIRVQARVPRGEKEEIVRDGTREPGDGDTEASTDEELPEGLGDLQNGDIRSALARLARASNTSKNGEKGEK